MKRYLVGLIALLTLLAACGGDAAETTTTVAPVVTTAGSSATTATPATTAAPATTTAPATTAAPATTTTAGPGSSSDAAAFSRALANTSEINSGRMEGLIEMTGLEDGPEEFSISFFGEFDNSAMIFHFVMDMSALAEAGGEEIPPEFADAFGEMEMLQIGDESYMKFGLFSILGVTTEWVSLPTDDAAGTAGSFGTPTPSDPLEFLRALDNGQVDVTVVGTETIRGVATTQYRITVDPEKLAEGATPEELEALEAQGLIGFDGAVPIDVWIDDDGLIHRYVVELTPTEADAAEAGFGMMMMTFDIFDHGQTIEVTAPDPADVTDFGSVGGFGFSG